MLVVITVTYKNTHNEGRTATDPIMTISIQWYNVLFAKYYMALIDGDETNQTVLIIIHIFIH